MSPGASIGTWSGRGSSWSARNTGGNTIEAGTEARISRVDGLTLHLN